MTAEPEDLAREIIADALDRAGGRPAAACAALVRLAGQKLAGLTSHDDACRLHAQLARRHAERAARCWKP